MNIESPPQAHSVLVQLQELYCSLLPAREAQSEQQLWFLSSRESCKQARHAAERDVLICGKAEAVPAAQSQSRLTSIAENKPGKR